MKKVYIPTEIRIENPVTITSIICASLEEYTPQAVFGPDNGLFQNEGTTNPQSITDQVGGFDSQTKGRGGDWGSIW